MKIPPILALSGLVLGIFLFICLFPMPYGYYTIVRLFSILVFGWYSITFFKQGYNAYGIISVILVLLFQPFFKVYFNKGLWNLIDILCSICLIILYNKHNKNGN